MFEITVTEVGGIPTKVFTGTPPNIRALFELAAARQDDFIVYDGFEDALGQRIGGSAHRAARQSKATEIVMPEIFRTTAVKIDLWSLRFKDAVSDSHMHIQDRTRISQWMAIMDAEIDKAGKRLGV